LQVGSLSLLGLSLSATSSSPAPDTGPKLYLEGYTDRSSYQPGDEVRIHVSTNASRYSIEFARLGASHEVVWSKDDLPGAEYPVPDDASARGCHWPVALTLRVPPAWKKAAQAASRVFLASLTRASAIPWGGRHGADAAGPA
jgi:hypothetical protein